ncbi:type IV pilus biogenesis protein PilP [Salmonella enterica subsp. enterica serovar Kentucky]|nr:type IV pilus biogenesis protein PilP [Salmonella enterica subsp. enterica serovar Kentucky]EBG6764870.1 type IV pilus biogenesis protein PilP [Salmonella enterica subsp. enterica]EAC1590309.1 type IV pilus biogenesis protein PilP [Salmonella enterica subsp. enterica serovar Kentucky]EBF8931040.1 type IV pilus biogenesis protein PilP [Salmonella enterica subsp. enterica serovar Kentucky]ECA7433688.1 type IV pilus biogenesis protein PilP [Salmonella enterica subsp. enterica serovar Kentucky]
MDSVHHIWCPLFSQEFQDLPDGAETTLTKQLEESDVNLSSETVSGFSGMTASLPSVSEQPTSKNRKELPVIMEINGKDKRLHAVLRMADGRQTSVTTGSQLPGTSVTVKSISLSGVTLSDGTTLTF